MRGIRKFFNRAKQIEDWQKYKKVLMTRTNVIREAKRNNFRKLCEGMEQTRETSRPYKGKDKAIASASLKNEDGAFNETEGRQGAYAAHLTEFYLTVESNSILPIPRNGQKKLKGKLETSKKGMLGN